MTGKESILEMMRSIPDTATIDEIIAELDDRFPAPEDSELTREEWEKVWAEEVDRRIEEIEAGKSVGIPLEAAMKWLEEKHP